ncbi:DNA repair protein RecO [Desulfobulbus oligotrophicus]|uniref:DNA repair protein RecO n=1 Tax=Desulfobulbus oligotrophicus TaxID=1909699 RepID=A0A7T6AQ74_9BACT|nr:DNA repair protein RecO [Desulfobulbus oligotrophicus]QQG65423.1 DNA repair protein RecO [Desulfobulbus oligotrophicus]
MNLLKTHGIVLRVAKYGESDKLITFYTTTAGRITGIAKGAQKSKRRFVNKLEEFTHLHIYCQPPRAPQGLFFISEAELLAAHLSLRTDVHRYVSAAYICDLFVRFTRDSDPDPQLYALLKWAMTALEQDKWPYRIVALTHLHLLGIAGYRPEINLCNHCRRPITATCSYMLLPGSGALLCNLCNSSGSLSLPRLSIHTLRLLATGQALPFNRLHHLHFTRKAIIESLSALYVYSLHLLQQDIHSWRTLCSLGFAHDAAPPGLTKQNSPTFLPPSHHRDHTISSP